jgi:hypothetical protein
LALTVRILLLLSRLLTAALLLARLLTGVLVSAGPDSGSGSTSGSPLLNVTCLLNVTGHNNPEIVDWFQGQVRFRRDH